MKCPICKSNNLISHNKPTDSELALYCKDCKADFFASEANLTKLERYTFENERRLITDFVLGKEANIEGESQVYSRWLVTIPKNPAYRNLVETSFANSRGWRLEKRWKLDREQWSLDDSYDSIFFEENPCPEVVVWVHDSNEKCYEYLEMLLDYLEDED
jgi:hypothetical protein